MIAHLTGTLLEKHVQRLIVDVGGVGYDVLVPLSTFYAVGEPGSRGRRCAIHTHVREDALQLFGFATPLEQTLFERLIAVSGIGPKLALAMLSGIEPANWCARSGRRDLARLTRIPGVGKKTAERIVLELRTGCRHAGRCPHDGGRPADDDVRDDLLSALANLGYQRARRREDASTPCFARTDVARVRAAPARRC